MDICLRKGRGYVCFISKLKTAGRVSSESESWGVSYYSEGVTEGVGVRRTIK